MSTELERHARAIRLARKRLARAYQDAERATHTAAGAGLSEVQISKALAVNRTTVRKWLGKPRGETTS